MKSAIEKNYNLLDRIEKWDPETQRMVKERLANELGDVLSYKFLTEREGEILEILVDILIPQEKNQNYIKISEIIDRKLAENTKGVRYGDNPWPREYYRRGLAEFEATAKEKRGKPIEDFSAEQLEKNLADIFSGGADDFLRKFLQRVLSDATAIYFSHPASWNKIGFPGPAYPEGYAYLECDKAFDWEPKYRS